MIQWGSTGIVLSASGIEYKKKWAIMSNYMGGDHPWGPPEWMVYNGKSYERG